MADYNIYIHAIGNSGATNENPTVPWSAREGAGNANPTASQTSGGGSGGGLGAAYMVTRGAAMISNPDSVVAAGVASITKALPWVAAAYAVVKVGGAIYENVLNFQVLETGFYGNQIAIQNFKQNVNNVFHPFSSNLNAYKIRYQWNIENQKQIQQRDLLGDSVINSYTGRGV